MLRLFPGKLSATCLYPGDANSLAADSIQTIRRLFVRSYDDEGLISVFRILRIWQVFWQLLSVGIWHSLKRYAIFNNTLCHVQIWVCDIFFKNISYRIEMQNSHRLCRINRPLSSSRKGVKYLRHLSVDKNIENTNMALSAVMKL